MSLTSCFTGNLNSDWTIVVIHPLSEVVAESEPSLRERCDSGCTPDWNWSSSSGLWDGTGCGAKSWVVCGTSRSVLKWGWYWSLGLGTHCAERQPAAGFKLVSFSTQGGISKQVLHGQWIQILSVLLQAADS